MKQLIIILTFGFLTSAFGQSFPGLEKTLAKEFSEKSDQDGRWVFYKDKANMEEINKPLVKAVIPDYGFYKVTLTNYLGYHVNESACLILYDSSRSKVLLVEPLWYSGISQQLIKLFIRKKFDSRDTLLSFLKELNELMEIGSGYKFVNTGATDALITYDLVYNRGDSYTTGGGGTSSTVNYTKDGIWRQIKIEIKNHKMMKYISTNSAANNEEVIK